VFRIFKIFKIVLGSIGLVLQMLQSMLFIYFHLFRSSSSEGAFHGGRLPDLDNFENCFGLYWTSPTDVTKHVLFISIYLGRLPVRSSSMEVVFQILKIVLGSTGLVLHMLGRGILSLWGGQK
jgi:hypothetical protein